jgi:hypothetical protein
MLVDDRTEIMCILIQGFWVPGMLRKIIFVLTVLPRCIQHGPSCSLHMWSTEKSATWSVTLPGDFEIVSTVSPVQASPSARSTWSYSCIIRTPIFVYRTPNAEVYTPRYTESILYCYVRYRASLAATLSQPWSSCGPRGVRGARVACGAGRPGGRAAQATA